MKADSGFQFHRGANSTPLNSTSNRCPSQVLAPLDSEGLRKTFNPSEFCCESRRLHVLLRPSDDGGRGKTEVAGNLDSTLSGQANQPDGFTLELHGDFLHH